MTTLLIAALAFLLLHVVVSGTRVRTMLTGVIGEGPYMGLFSLASIGLLVWLGIAFGAARAESANVAYWPLTRETLYTQLGVTLIAFLLAVPGLTTPNPTSVRQEGTLDRPDVVKGMLRITRHPFLWGVAIWAAGHLMVNGRLANIILFGSLLVLAVLGTFSIDAKRKRALGPKWDTFAGQTSNVPFAAIAAGRQTLNIGEIGWWRIALAVVVWAALAWVHPMAFGPNALP
jgi:uncharacterized membrane protein